MIIYFWERERKSAHSRMRASWGGAQRDGDQDSKAGSHRQQTADSRMWCGAQTEELNYEIMTWAGPIEPPRRPWSILKQIPRSCHFTKSYLLKELFNHYSIIHWQTMCFYPMTLWSLATYVQSSQMMPLSER